MSHSSDSYCPALPPLLQRQNVKLEPPETPIKPTSTFSLPALGPLMMSLKRAGRGPGLVLSPTPTLAYSSTSRAESAHSSTEIHSPSTTILGTPPLDTHTPQPSLDLSNASRCFEQHLTAHQQVLLGYPAKYNSETAQALDNEVYHTREALVADHRSLIDLLADVIAYNTEARSIEEKFTIVSQQWEESLAKEKAQSDRLRLSLHESSEIVKDYEESLRAAHATSKRLEAEMKKMNTELKKANAAKTQADRDRDSLRKQIDRLIEAQDTKARQLAGAQEGKRQMAGERDKARVEAEAAVKEMERMKVELSKMEMGQQAARSLSMRLGESSTKRKLEE